MLEPRIRKSVRAAIRRDDAHRVNDLLSEWGGVQDRGRDGLSLVDVAIMARARYSLIHLVAVGAELALPAPDAPDGPPWQDDLEAIRFLLEVAISLDDTELVAKIIPSRLDVNCRFANGDTPLHAAARYSHDVLRQLVAMEADLYAVNGENQLPLFLLAGSDTEAVLLMIEAGCNDPDVLRRSLRFAATAYDRSAVPVLLAAGARPGLIEAICLEDEDLTRTLIEQCEDVNLPIDGELPLVAASCWDNVSITGILLDAGADPNLSNALGELPLVNAVQCCHTDVAEVLLDAGALPRLPDAQGRTALGVAREYETPMLRLVKRYAPGRGRSPHKKSRH
jgi:ankyrin repeat protein